MLEYKIFLQVTLHDGIDCRLFLEASIDVLRHGCITLRNMLGLILFVYIES